MTGMTPVNCPERSFMFDVESERGLGIEIVKTGGYEILTPTGELQDQLLRIEKAGRICYQSEKGPITQESAARFVRMLIKRGHESVIEHSCLTVLFRNCSRGFTHEIVRHRLASFSQESTRYVDYAKGGEGPDLERFGLKCIAPPHRDEEERVVLRDGRSLSFAEMVKEVQEFYRALRKAGWPPEDARQILPTAIKADIVVTTNFREWRHIFEMRTQKAAHWEIRGVMVKLLEELKQIVPPIFEDFVLAGVDQNGIKYFEKKSL